MRSRSQSPLTPDEANPQAEAGASERPEKLESSARRARGLASLVESLLPATREKTVAEPPTRQAVEIENQEPPELLDLLLAGPDAVLVLDRDGGEILEVGKRFADWCGTSREQLVGKPFLSLFAETEHRAARKLFTEGSEGNVYVLEVPSTNQHMQPHLIEFTSSASELGGGRFFVVVGRDVGARAITERYLRAERDRMNLIIRSMRDILIMLTSGGDIEYCNPAAEQAFEQYELPVICHRWISAFSRQDKTDLQGLTSAYEGQTIELTANDDRVFLVTRSFIFDSGQKAKIMLLAKDITDQRVIEEQNHQLQLELMRESKLAEFGMLSAGIAHNMRGPLTGILGFCELLQLRHPDLKEINQIHSQALAMNALISNLMHKSRSEQETEPQDLLMEDLIRTELQFLEANLFYKHDIEKQIDIQSPLPTVHGIYSDFSQVFGNLLRNAIDAMHDREVRLLTVKAWKEDRNLFISVSDTGCGMSEEVRAKLFTPFFTTKPKHSEAAPGDPVGTGLGLSTSRRILSKYGADLDVESQPGKGSTFVMRVPLNRKYVTDK